MGVKIEVPPKVPRRLIKLRLEEGPILDYIMSKRAGNEPLVKTVLRIIKFMMFLDRYASENKRVADLLRYVYRRARELGVLS